ncbi:hypothetical protein QZH41_011270 [Actinostola sp. cb2023]|nr:hypothetical protein QZH41_011270 [Actinostola sp. cb2023]
MKDEEKQSGISPEISEVDQAIMEIIDMEEASEVEMKQNSEKKKDKIESERKGAEEVRKKAMEKCGDTQKRKARVKGDDSDDDNDEPKLKGMKAKELEFMEKKHNDAMEMQREMMQSMSNQQQKQQQQLQDVQSSFLQQQQQQSMAMMAFVERLLKK